MERRVYVPYLHNQSWLVKGNMLIITIDNSWLPYNLVTNKFFIKSSGGSFPKFFLHVKRNVYPHNQ